MSKKIDFMPTVEICQKAFDFLQLNGYFNDEMCLGSATIEYFSIELIDFLKEMGYEGNLMSYGNFYSTHGAVYWIFDTDKLSIEESKKMTDKWVNEL